MHVALFTLAHPSRTASSHTSTQTSPSNLKPPRQSPQAVRCNAGRLVRSASTPHGIVAYVDAAATVKLEAAQTAYRLLCLQHTAPYSRWHIRASRLRRMRRTDVAVQLEARQTSTTGCGASGASRLVHTGTPVADYIVAHVHTCIALQLEATQTIAT